MEAIKNLLAQITLFCSFNSAVVDKLDEHETTMANIKQNNERLNKVHSGYLRTVQEIHLAFADFRKNTDKRIRELLDENAELKRQLEAWEKEAKSA